MPAPLPRGRANRGERTPDFPVPLERPALAGAGGLAISWLGHASTLVDVEGVRVFLDPIWSARCSPSAVVGPRRLHPPPVGLADLLPIDVVLISHDHHDHLDMRTVRELNAITTLPFAVPLGIGAHLERWGVAPSRIVELDWGEQATVGGVELILTPAQHFSGRGLRDRDSTLWGSWVISASRRRVFYSGDSGWLGRFAVIDAAASANSSPWAVDGSVKGWEVCTSAPELLIGSGVNVARAGIPS